MFISSEAQAAADQLNFYLYPSGLDTSIKNVVIPEYFYPPKEEQGGLGTGAIIGITLGGLAVIGLITFLILRKK